MSGKNRKTGNLVALGSAAVVAVYGAGFMRTAEAAQRFAEQSDERRVVADDVAPAASTPNAVGDSGSAANVVSNERPYGAVTAQSKSTAHDSAALTAAVGNSNKTLNAANPERIVAAAAIKKVDATTAKVAPQSVAESRSNQASVPMPPEVTTVMSASGVAVTPPQATTPAEKPASTVAVAPSVAASASTAPASAPAAPSSPVQPAPVKTVAPTAPASTSAPTAVAPAIAPATATPAAGATRWKDGEYTGYGTSRHGDVEVYVETTDGKITYVKISQCLTQYSCSWIEDLPKQVLARQSTKVDGVSGATQSANAFYYALVAALAKAK